MWITPLCMDNFLPKNKMKRKNRFLLISTCLAMFVGLNNFDVNAQAVGISATSTFTPNPSSILDVSSTDKGILIPRLTTGQRDLINPTANAYGLMIYNTTSKKFNYWDGAKWNDVGTGSAAAVPYWHFGSGDPIADVPATGVSYLGAPNDYYYNNTNGRLFKKNSGNQWNVAKTNPGDEFVTFKNTFKTTITEIDPLVEISIPANNSVKRTFTVPNAVIGAVVSVSPELELPDGIVISYARVVSAETVEVKFVNASLTPKDLKINGAKYFISVLN